MIKAILYNLALLAGSLLPLAGIAQAQQTVPRCGTAEAVAASLAAHPEKRLALEALERFTRNRDLARRAGRLSADSQYVIPIVFHIIHNFGSENITDAQVIDAVRVLNADYSRTSNDTNRISANFRPIAAEINFQFRLARKDPSGNCTNGITRTVSGNTVGAGEEVKDIISWDTRRYLNIWVVRSIGSGAGGYAFYPGSAPQQSHEGIVVVSTQTGSIGVSGGGNFASRTLTHEVGHYFNLAHTWGSTNEPGLPSNCGTDDGVSDTPNTVGTSNQSCNLTQSTCGLIDNVENYMDYSDCGRMFTLGQKDRVRAASESAIGGRSNLWIRPNLAFTGVGDTGPRTLCAPTVAISEQSLRTCVQSSLTYKANVSGADQTAPLSYLWSMPGATPSTSTDPTPQVVYSQPGQYDVRLTVTNTAGQGKDSVSNATFIYSNTPAYNSTRFEGFEDAVFPIVNNDPFQPWEFTSDRNGVNWGVSTASAYEGTRSLRVSAQALGAGQKATATTPSFDLTGISPESYISFRMASARRTLTSRDEFRIYISTNCGRTYTQRFSRIGTNPTNGAYTTLTNYTGSYIPAASHWRKERMSLISVLGRADVRLRFELTGGGGNAFYLDSIALVDPTITSSKSLSQGTAPSLWPNPSSGEVTLDIPASAGLTAYQIFNPIGMLIASGKVSGKSSLPVSSLPAGAYLIRVQLADGPWAQRLILTR